MLPLLDLRPGRERATAAPPKDGVGIMNFNTIQGVPGFVRATERRARQPWRTRVVQHTGRYTGFEITVEVDRKNALELRQLQRTNPQGFGEYIGDMIDFCKDLERLLDLRALVADASEGGPVYASMQSGEVPFLQIGSFEAWKAVAEDILHVGRLPKIPSRVATQTPNYYTDERDRSAIETVYGVLSMGPDFDQQVSLFKVFTMPIAATRTQLWLLNRYMSPETPTVDNFTARGVLYAMELMLPERPHEIPPVSLEPEPREGEEGQQGAAVEEDSDSDDAQPNFVVVTGIEEEAGGEEEPHTPTEPEGSPTSPDYTTDSSAPEDDG